MACGPYKVEVEPVEVHVKFNMDDLKQYFQVQCEQLVLAGQYSGTVDQCATQKVGEFLSTMQYYAQPSPSPRP